MSASFLGAQQLKTDKVQTSARESYDDGYVAYAELKTSIDKKIGDSLRLKMKIGNEIDQLSDRKQKYVLKARYVLNKSWKDIAYSLNYTERHVHRIHGKALIAFGKKYCPKLSSNDTERHCKTS
ncbi:DUF1492 domain-containing protein [Mycobacteroides abscessus]|uniref:DUF1492 domain-containing protein n=1 Tax=unclassified Desemzia TaxID=2685243 RepID=UPI0009A5F0E7